jgi:hypothetical protein
MTSRATQTVQDALAESVRGAARAFAPGDQVAPCAVLWLDPERIWEPKWGTLVLKHFTE